MRHFEISTLLTGVRESIFCGIERYRLRIFAVFKAFQHTVNTFWAMQLWIVAIAVWFGVLIFPGLQTIAEGILIALCVWSMRPSTEPKSWALFFSQSIRVLLVVAIGALLCLCGRSLATWCVVLAAYFIFEVRTDRTLFSLPLSFLLLMSTTLSVGLIFAAADIAGLFISWGSIDSLARWVGVLLRPLLVTVVTIPLIVEQFHTNRAWYEPL